MSKQDVGTRSRGAIILLSPLLFLPPRAPQPRRTQPGTRGKWRAKRDEGALYLCRHLTQHRERAP